MGINKVGPDGSTFFLSEDFNEKFKEDRNEISNCR